MNRVVYVFASTIFFAAMFGCDNTESQLSTKDTSDRPLDTEAAVDGSERETKLYYSSDGKVTFNPRGGVKNNRMLIVVNSDALEIKENQKVNVTIFADEYPNGLPFKIGANTERLETKFIGQVLLNAYVKVSTEPAELRKNLDYLNEFHLQPNGQKPLDVWTIMLFQVGQRKAGH